MGTNYSSGPFPLRLQSVFKELSLTRVRALMLKFEKLRRGQVDVVKRDALFLSRDEVKRLFKLKVMQVYEMFRLLDHEHLGRISVLDLWGALALSTQNSPDDKVEFLFRMMDYAKSGYLSRTDLQTLMVCATRGLARIKNIRPPDVKILNKTLSVIAGMAFVNENGGISLRDVRVTMLMDENCKAYFAGLGSQVLALDSGMLVAQRRDILFDLATVEAQIDELVLRLNVKKEDKEAYDAERGGDIASLRVSDMKALVGGAAKEEAEAQSSDNTSVVQLDALGGVPSDEQRFRRMQRAKLLSAAQGTPNIADAAVFVDPSARQPHGSDTGGGASNFDAQAVQRKWSTLKCADDGMCELDVDIVEDLFEAAGVVLTDQEAEDCLRAVPVNQLGRRRVQDVVEWYRAKLCTDVPVRVLPLWRKVAADVFEALRSTQDSVFQAAADLRTQRSLVVALAEKDKTVRALIAGGTHAGEAAELMVSMGEIQGSQRLVAWQRQQLQADPARLTWALTFGHPEDVPMPCSPDAPEGGIDGDKDKKLSKMQALLAREKEKEQKKELERALAEWERNKWKMSLQLDVSVLPPPTTIADRASFFDPASLVMKDDLEAADLLDVFKRVVPASDSSAPVELPNGSVAWVSFTLKPESTEEDEVLLVKLLVNFFESVPTDYRANAYTSVAAKALKLPAPTATEPSASSRVVLLALLHQEDWFRTLEESLPPGLMLSRALRGASLSVRGLDSLDDLYRASLSLEAFEDRLFGPQEDELGDEGMHPIRFAKMQRQRQTALQDSIAGAFRMSEAELRVLLRDRGLSVHGSHSELATRARAAFKRQAQIYGFGELSAFGADLCSRIYAKFLAARKPVVEDDKVTSSKKVSAGAPKQLDAKSKAKAATAAQLTGAADDGMSLWELNALLHATGTETIHDNKEYRRILEEQQLYTDRDGRLLREGMTAYYEAFGRLAADVRKLGLSSLGERLKGEVFVSTSYEPSALASFLALFEDHTLLQRPLKVLAGLLSSARDLSLESEFDSLSDLLRVPGAEPLAPLLEALSAPGWLSSAVHRAAEWLADEEEGVLRSLRGSVFETFGKYHVWDEAFTDFFSSFRRPDHHGDDTIDPLVQLSERLVDILPPRCDLSENNSVQRVVELRRLNVRLGEIISDRTTYQLSREQREELMALRVRTESKAAEMMRKVEDEKQHCCAHALALYDGIRRCVLGVRHLGCGTKDLTIKAKVSGLDWARYLPKGVGEAAIPRQMREDKMRRAIQRKQAAFNALERDRARKDKSGPDRALRKEQKAAQLLLKRREEEARMFDEAFSALTNAREERKSASEIANMVRLWERLHQLKQSRYPKTLASAICQNNLASVLTEFYGPEHFKGKEALGLMEDSAATVVTAILALTPVNDMPEDVDPPHENSLILLRRQGVVALSEEEEAGLAESETFCLDVPEDWLVPFLSILQNSLTVLRLATGDPRNEAALDKLWHTRRFVAALYGMLSIKERDRVKKKATRALEGVPVFYMQDVEMQLAATLAELQAQGDGNGEQGDDLSIHSDSQGSATGSAEVIRPKKRSTLAGGALGISKENLDMEVALKRAERQDKDAKMADTRREANLVRAQTVRRRNRLYHLITSGEINRIFDLKAGHVLSEGTGIRWGTEEASVDPLAFLDSDQGTSVQTGDEQTMTTFQTGSILTSSDHPKKKKETKRVTMQIDDQSLGGESIAGWSVASLNEEAPSVTSNDNKQTVARPKGRLGLLNWLFRNRDVP